MLHIMNEMIFFYLWIKGLDLAAEVEMVVKSQLLSKATPTLLSAPDWFNEVGDTAQVLPTCPDPAKPFNYHNHNKATYPSCL